MSEEALKTSEIEGEYLNRDSLQSSIRKNLGLTTGNRKVKPSEQGIADMMTDLYQNFSNPLTHEALFKWHTMLMQGNKELNDIGCYRTHAEPMQVVSGALQQPKIHFEAPPSKVVPAEMERFINWFNNTAPGGNNTLPALARAGIAHLYFVCIHPFEDGNGRIGRALIIKALCESLNQPVLIALSYIIQKNRKQYYEALERNNKGHLIMSWLLYFAKTIIDAQESWGDFEKKLEDNLYVIWNRLASGTYFPSAVKEVEIPKKEGKTRKLGIPTLHDRIAQEVVRKRINRIFHDNSYVKRWLEMKIVNKEFFGTSNCFTWHHRCVAFRSSANQWAAFPM